MVPECHAGSLIRKLRLGGSRTLSKVILLVGVGVRCRLSESRGLQIRKWSSALDAESFFFFLFWFCCPWSVEARPMLPREGGREWGGGGGNGRGEAPALTSLWLLSEWPNPLSGHQKLGFYTWALVLPLLSWISSRPQRFSIVAAHQGLVLLLFAQAFDQRVLSTKGTARKCFLRAAQDFLGWLQRSESNLQLLCGRPRGLGGSAPVSGGAN